MQVVLDIPEPLYRALELQALADHTSLETLLVEGAQQVLAREGSPTALREQRRVKLPLFKGGEVGPLMLSGVNLNEYVFATEDEWEQLERDLA